MATDQIKTEVRALKEGMFVSDLDRPWHETPFPLQGFYVKSEDDIKAIAPYCRYVYVDVKKTKVPEGYSKHAVSEKPSRAKASKSVSAESRVLELPKVVIKNPETYEIGAPIGKEVARMGMLHEKVHEALVRIYNDVAEGKKASVKDSEQFAVSMVVSVVRNPDALVWLSKMDEGDDHSYQHVVKSAVWSLVFARHLGLSKPLMKTLAMGILLSQVGKAKLPRELLENPDALEGEERAEFESYVHKSVDILSQMEGISDGVIHVAQCHRERHNGSGFPQGLTGDRIPLLAKIAGLVDAYQDMITPKGDAEGMSPFEAVTRLYELRNVQFQQDLVERFIEAIGVYPTGTLVELSSKQVGIVTGHNLERRLQPKLIVVLDENKQALKSAKRLDLKEWNDVCKPGQEISIKESLPKGAYNINENDYLLTGATSKWSLKHLAGRWTVQ
jgi:HD-GYP domain-containing protein (c-di-GMP phosphodiesterase class II)